MASSSSQPTSSLPSAAVRFGRVPKREKAKILAAMQKVNMSSMEKQLTEQLDDEGRLLSSLLAAHDETCDYTRDKVAPLLDRARAHPVFASCPSSMVSSWCLFPLTFSIFSLL